MKRKRRKIGFYYLTVANEEITVLEALTRVLSHINRLDRINRRLDLGSNKFCFLDSMQLFQNSTRCNIVFKSATHSYRPNLIHRETINERENPKRLLEGESEKTHIVTKSINDEIVFLMERQLNGISVNQFVKYLNTNSIQMENEMPIKFGYEIMVKDNFLEEIDHLSRVTAADIYVDKQLLGSEALNYSNRTNQVKHEVILTVKAKNRGSIINFAHDLFARLNGGENTIRKIRITGRNEENNEVVIKTDFIERQEFIMPEINEVTGEVSTTQIFVEMNAVIQNFN